MTAMMAVTMMVAISFAIKSTVSLAGAMEPDRTTPIKKQLRNMVIISRVIDLAGSCLKVVRRSVFAVDSTSCCSRVTAYQQSAEMRGQAIGSRKGIGYGRYCVKPKRKLATNDAAI
ncbi:hypothetical protein EGYY_23410 [Eggerthella sp. YY7918]|nr:hypothetical protein EGYY_23410 [Eggerthella sp. YY7918]